MSAKSFALTRAPTVLVAAAFLLAAAEAPAQDGRGYRAPVYNEPPSRVEPRPANPLQVNLAPVKYHLEITRLPQAHNSPDANVAVVMAHLPQDAAIYFQDLPTTSTGPVRWFESPTLSPGKHYHYNVRVIWYENGKWVSQASRLTVAAGELHCVELSKAREAEGRAEIAANLGMLSAEDRKPAEEQKYCAIQGDKLLGQMGVPVKVMLQGQPVFLCCEGCVKKAESDPAATVARVRELRRQNAHPALK
jgi:uncharacterized protein (TIGR03000 family)